MKLKKFFTLILIIFSCHSAFAQPALKSLAESMSPQQVWDALLAVNQSGETIFGKCRLSDARNCTTCYCAYYFVGNKQGKLGAWGWGKNPSSGDGTGCTSWKGSPTTPIDWPSKSGIVFSSDIKQYVKNILLNAINEGDVCSVPTPPNVKGGISVLDTTKFLFVNPKESCASGKILCGTPALGGQVGGLVQFIKLSESICKAAWGTASKSKNNQAKMISCQQYESQALDQKVIQEAALMVGQMNTGYDLFAQAGAGELLTLTKDQLEKLEIPKVALYYLLVGKNKNNLPTELHDRVKPEKLTEARTSQSEPKYIVQSDLDEAQKKLEEIQKGVIKPSNYTLEQAVQFCKANDPRCNYK